MFSRFCFPLFSFLFLSLSVSSPAKEIVTNNLHFVNAPEWLTEARLESVTRKVQDFLEWDIRKIKVYYYPSDQDFKSQHGLNFMADAFFKPSDSTVHVSTRVNKDNFDRI